MLETVSQKCGDYTDQLKSILKLQTLSVNTTQWI